ncbi:MAG: PAS domain-containing protein [Deltaproteobacteria bacterium]|uniref:two-component system sensor histidine kinase NtrB n=1 Tax=Hydrosulfovibrio ferrireducens TaxID=2934181 RepID=UPI0012276D60|nr:MAG: PAS domain-containing protein [Deltaproteobacteria bacterium]
MIPKSTPSFKFSRVGLTIVAASIILLSVLTVITFLNLNREQQMMKHFLLQEGLTLIRAFEAGTRISIMQGWQGEDNLVALVQETAKSPAIAYISVINEQGKVMAAAGEWRDSSTRPPVSQVLSHNIPLTNFAVQDSPKKIFEVAKEFNPGATLEYGWENWQSRWQQWCQSKKNGTPMTGRQAIFVGLYTAEFDEARKEDVKQALIMGGILFLLGSAGLYFIFLYQGIRVSRSTLADMELYTRNVIESMPAGLLTLDTRGRIVSSNGKMEELLGKPVSELEGKTLRQIAGNRQSQMEPLVQGGTDFVDLPLEYQRQNGETIPVKVSAARLLNKDGKWLGTVLTFRDMREIREMEEKLERSRRLAALGRMAAGIAHEIRNPLGTLRGFAQYFGGQAQDGSAKRYAELMIGEVDRLNRTISALLQFAKPREPEFEKVVLGELLTKTAQLLADDFKNHAVAFGLDVPEEDILLEADPDLFIQVLLNLLQNALAAVEEEGSIVLGARRYSDAVHVWVRDNGKGMTQEEQARMFDPFFSTRKTGTGLGLAVVHNIVEQHHARIDVESENGKGTTVTLVLPIHQGERRE